MPQLLCVKALMNYVGPLGSYVTGQEFKRPIGLRGAFANKPQHFKITEIIDTESVVVTPPADGVKQIDYTKMPGYECNAEDKRLVKWNGNGPVEFAGRRLMPGTEIIVPVSWVDTILKSEGFSLLRNKIRPSGGLTDMTLSANAIVTVSEAIGWLGDATQLTDLILEPLIDRASDMAERITNRHFKKRTGTVVYYDGNGSKYLRLFHYPVITVTSLYVDNDREFNSEDLWTEGEDFLVYGNDGLIAVWASANSTQSQVYWPKGTMNIKLTLTYGYEDEDIPDDLKQAVLEIVQDLYCRRTTSRAIKSESMLNYSVTYASTNVGPIPQTAYDTLLAYADPLGGYDLFQEA